MKLSEMTKHEGGRYHDGEWMDIPECSGEYQANRKGQIRSVDRHTVSKKGTKRFFKGIILKPGLCPVPNHKTRLIVGVKIDGVRRTIGVHILVGRTFIPNPNKLPQINHKDGNPFNNHVDNLEWIDNYGNMVHAFENNLISKAVGQNNGKSKLTDKQAVEIFNSKLSHSQLRLKYNVSKRTISDIRSGHSWGSANGLSRTNKILKESDVIDIYSRSKTAKELCDKYQVTKHVIYKIWYKINYSQITNKLC